MFVFYSWGCNCAKNCHKRSHCLGGMKIGIQINYNNTLSTSTLIFIVCKNVITFLVLLSNNFFYEWK